LIEEGIATTDASKLWPRQHGKMGWSSDPRWEKMKAGDILIDRDQKEKPFSAKRLKAPASIEEESIGRDRV